MFVKITTWNCRGLGNSEPYLRHLSNSSQVILLQEHWLWPFELQKLSSVLPEFSATGKADSRLTEHYNVTRGCGGVAILWNKSIDISPLTVYTNNRICGVEIQLPENDNINKIIIYNIYCPSSDYTFDTYEQCINDLEEEINSHLSESTAIVIAGDFNAHLGTLAGCRGSGTPNSRGIVFEGIY